MLLTHQHPDHVDIDRLPALLEANPAAQLIADAGTVAMLADKGLQARTARAGETFELSGTAVHAVGGEHAVIHPDVPVIDNVGFVLENGAFYHPGDSFFVPEERIDVLGLPTGAPWLKLSEAVDFLRAVAPRTAVPIHEAVLSRPQMHYRMFEQLRPEHRDQGAHRGTAGDGAAGGAPQALHRPPVRSVVVHAVGVVIVVEVVLGAVVEVVVAPVAVVGSPPRSAVVQVVRSYGRRSRPRRCPRRKSSSTPGGHIGSGCPGGSGWPPWAGSTSGRSICCSTGAGGSGVAGSDASATPPPTSPIRPAAAATANRVCFEVRIWFLAFACCSLTVPRLLVDLESALKR